MTLNKASQAVVIASAVLSSPIYASELEAANDVKKVYGENTALIVTDGSDAYAVAQELKKHLGKGGTIKALISCDSLLPNQGYSIVHTTAHELQFADLNLEQAIVIKGLLPNEHKTADKDIADLKTKTKVTETDHTTFSLATVFNSNEVTVTPAKLPLTIMVGAALSSETAYFVKDESPVVLGKLKGITDPAKVKDITTISIVEAINGVQPGDKLPIIQFRGTEDELLVLSKLLTDDVANVKSKLGGIVFLGSTKSNINALAKKSLLDLPGVGIISKQNITLDFNSPSIEALAQATELAV